jgi:hypothetical protein
MSNIEKSVSNFFNSKELDKASYAVSYAIAYGIAKLTIEPFFKLLERIDESPEDRLIRKELALELTQQKKENYIPLKQRIKNSYDFKLLKSALGFELKDNELDTFITEYFERNNPAEPQLTPFERFMINPDKYLDNYFEDKFADKYAESNIQDIEQIKERKFSEIKSTLLSKKNSSEFDIVKDFFKDNKSINVQSDVKDF